MRSGSILVGVCYLAVVATALSAQKAHIAGHTHAQGDTLRVVADAEVSLSPGSRSTRSDSAGSFDFAAVADGTYRLRVRRLGFAVKELDVAVVGQHDLHLQVPLYAAPQMLAEVTIAGKRVLIPARYADAYARIGRANGDFFTSEKIDSMHALDMKSLLQTIPGVMVNDRGITFRRCETGFTSQGIPSSLSAKKQPSDSSSLSPIAHVQVYVDGVRVTGYAGRGRDDAEHALRDIQPSSLQLVEVYRGVSRIPGEYLDDACAVILVWTK